MKINVKRDDDLGRVRVDKVKKRSERRSVEDVEMVDVVQCSTEIEDVDLEKILDEEVDDFYSMVTGVYYAKKWRKWRVVYNMFGVRINLGAYEDKEMAEMIGVNANIIYKKLLFELEKKSKIKIINGEVKMKADSRIKKYKDTADYYRARLEKLWKKRGKKK